MGFTCLDHPSSCLDPDTSHLQATVLQERAQLQALVAAATKHVRLSGRKRCQSHVRWMGLFTMEGRRSYGRPVYAREALDGNESIGIFWYNGEWRVGNLEEGLKSGSRGIKLDSEALVLEEADGQWEVWPPCSC